MCAPGAELHPELKVPVDAVRLKKGSNPEVDSYSAFFDNTGQPASGDTGLAHLLMGAVTEASRLFNYLHVKGRVSQYF
jgi:nicotinamidase-related amidase